MASALPQMTATEIWRRSLVALNMWRPISVRREHPAEPMNCSWIIRELQMDSKGIVPGL